MTRLDRTSHEQPAAEEWVTYGGIIDTLVRVPNGVTALLDALASGDIKARLVDPPASPPTTGDPVLDKADPASPGWWQLYNARRRARPNLEQEWTGWFRNCVEVQQAPALQICNNPITRGHRTKAVWQPFTIRTILRQRKELRTGFRERRGRPKRYDDQAYIRIYIEIEARARLLTTGIVLRLLRHPQLRLPATNGRLRPLNRNDKFRLRQQHAEGKREVLFWRDTRFMDRPHPKWCEIERLIEARRFELQLSPQKFLLVQDYFFSK